MKINSPASTVEGAIKAIDSGADEIYCGVKLEGMKYVTFNGRPGYGSLDNFEQLKQVTDYAHKKMHRLFCSQPTVYD
jgi:collagenase-like PrtC family protease